MTRLDDLFSFQQTALRVRAQKQVLIASNIANADTPNYKAKQLDFARALEQALGSRTGRTGLNQTAAAHLAGNTTANATLEATREPDVAGQDGNNVNVDHERGAFMDNALRYEASVNIVNGQVKKLLSVLQG